MQSVRLLFNPLAGNYSARLIDRIAAAFAARKISATLCDVTAPAQPPANGHICVIGGDGSLRHVVAQQLAGGTAQPLSIYPAGTVNLIARELHCSDNPAHFAAQLIGPKAQTHTAFAASINDDLFLACATVGPDALAVDSVSLTLKKRIGRSAYAVSLLRLFLRWPRCKLSLTFADRTLQCEAFTVVKARHYAGPWALENDAAMGNKFLTVLAFSTMRRRDYAALLCQVLRGRPASSLSNVTRIDCLSFHAAADGHAPIQADGDVIAALPARFALIETPITYLA